MLHLRGAPGPAVHVELFALVLLPLHIRLGAAVAHLRHLQARAGEGTTQVGAQSHSMPGRHAPAQWPNSSPLAPPEELHTATHA